MCFALDSCNLHANNFVFFLTNLLAGKAGVEKKGKEGNQSKASKAKRQDCLFPTSPHLSCCSPYELPLALFASYQASHERPMPCLHAQFQSLLKPFLLTLPSIKTSRSLSPSLTHLPLTGNVYVPYYHLTAPTSPIRFSQLSQRLRIPNRQR